MFSGITIWYSITNWCALLWDDYLSLPKLFLVDCSSFSRAQESLAFPIHFSISTIVVLVQLVFRHSCWWDSMGVDSNITRRHSLTANFLIDPLALPFFSPPLQQHSLRLCAGIVLCMYPQLWFQLLYCTFYNVLYQLQRKVSFMEDKNYTDLWI